MKTTPKLVILCLILALLLPVSPLKAQTFNKGDKVLSFGLGLGSTYIAWDPYYKTTVPPIFVAGDYCLREKLGPGNLGVGGILAYSAYKWNYSTVDWGYKYTNFFIGARGTYHFTDLVDKLDLYGGVVLGAKIVTYKEYGQYAGYGTYNTNSSGVLYDIFGGARYYLADNFGVMGELGYGIAWLKLGVSLKF
jgi:hypothetical protein